MADFVPIPKIPQQDVTPWMYAVLTALAEDMEVLMGVRSSGTRAVTSDRVTVVPQAFQQLKRITADHLQLSDVYFLEQIPPGRTARDILLIDVPTAKRGPPWNLWLGLWEMRGDGHRMKVLQVNGLTTAEDRVLLGTVQIPQRP